MKLLTYLIGITSYSQEIDGVVFADSNTLNVVDLTLCNFDLYQILNNFSNETPYVFNVFFYKKNS